MRVLHVYSGNLNGGVESLLKTLAAERHLCGSMDPEYALCFDDALARGLRATGVSVSILGSVRVSQPWTIVQARHRLARMLRQERFDTVICHSSWPHLIFAPVVRAASLPLVYWRHDASGGGHWVDRWAAQTVPDLVICNSRFTARTFEQTYPGVPRSILYYPVIAPATTSAVEISDIRTRFKTAPGAVVIVQPSRLEHWKGHRLHLQALRLLMKVPDWICWVAGGPQRPAEERYFSVLKEEARSYGIAERVRFLGWVEDLPKLLAAAQIHCQPNTGPEPFGLTFLEAMGAGLPVVTTEQGALCEIVTPDSGILVPPDDPATLARALRGLVQDPGLRLRLGAGARARAREMCDPERQLLQLAVSLMDLVERKSGRAIAS